MPSGGDSKGNDDNDLGDGASLGCTERCTDATETGGADAPGGHFAAALAMIAGLPLTDAEKAEAVRRLLAVTTTKTPADARGNAGFGGGVTGGER